ncbi:MULTISPECIES: DUF3667 domain-containing protein [Myxococcaceae]|uniref:DUF3667 domain-containing protein n=1 Tax=Myxococcaceae TaxID=31 RepID=UPI00189061BA|nr:MULTISPECIES: DUF3667 domain-containing protein [Myxococcaceae]MBF5042225.1 DUF3667 domain-containing protein [Simulacricoccus sp. 17bor-14]
MHSSASGAASVTVGGAARHCTQCEAELHGSYCAQCGLKRFERHDLSLEHYAHEAFHEIFHVDGRLWRTLRLLFTRPGQLTQEAVSGRRALSVTPMRLFLLTSALFFFVGHTSYFTLDTIVRYEPGSTPEASMAKAEGFYAWKGKKLGQPPELVKEHLEAQFASRNKLAQIATVGLFVLLLAGLYLGSGHYFVEHLIFGLHVYSFRFIFSTLTEPLIVKLKVPWQVSLPIGTLVIASYLFLALRRVYGGHPLATALRTLVLVAAFQVFTFFAVYLSITSVMH